MVLWLVAYIYNSGSAKAIQVYNQDLSFKEAHDLKDRYIKECGFSPYLTVVLPYIKT